MPRFKTGPSSELRIYLDGDESALMRRLVDEMLELLSDPLPRDPVLGRIFPDAYEDPDDARAFRELVADDLKADKERALNVVKETLGSKGKVHTSLSTDQVDAWLKALTDMRLAIGTRIGVDEEKMTAEVDVDDPEAPSLAVLHWLGWVQESMLETITADQAG